MNQRIKEGIYKSWDNLVGIYCFGYLTWKFGKSGFSLYAPRLDELNNLQISVLQCSYVYAL